jgi:hypothetical protein
LAQSLSGIVIELNREQSSITVEEYDPDTDTATEAIVMVTPETQWKGIESFEELLVGDEIRVDVAEAEGGLKKALSVQLEYAEEFEFDEEDLGDETLEGLPAAEEAPATVPAQ